MEQMDDLQRYSTISVPTCSNSFLLSFSTITETLCKFFDLPIELKMRFFTQREKSLNFHLAWSFSRIFQLKILAKWKEPQEFYGYPLFKKTKRNFTQFSKYFLGDMHIGCGQFQAKTLACLNGK